MALYSVVFVGSTPIGAPLMGGLAQIAGPRAGMALGGAAALVAAAWGRVAYARARERVEAAAASAPELPPERAGAPAAHREPEPVASA